MKKAHVAWDPKEPSLIIRARMMAMPPETVYRELQSYGEYLKPIPLLIGEADYELEQALAGRAHPLIDLGLAQFGGSKEVMSAIYVRAVAGSGDHNRALRLAVLGNPSALKHVFGGNRYGAITDEEAKRLAASGDGDELRAWLLNSGDKHVLADLFMRKSPFDAVPDGRFLSMLELACANPAFTDDDSNELGPDMYAWDIQKGIHDLLKTAPVTERWLECLYRVLLSLNPAGGHGFHEDPYPILYRWRNLRVSDKFAESHKEMGQTPLAFQEEFCCLMAALYGQWYAKEGDSLQTRYAGDPESPDLMLRCAHYGTQRLTVEQMARGHDRDGETFTFAALWNEGLFWNRTTRARLEQLLPGNLRRLYNHRCQQIHKQHPKFDPQPVTEDVLEPQEEVAPTESHEQRALQRLEATVAAIKAVLTRLRFMLVCGLMMLVLILLLVWHPHW